MRRGVGVGGRWMEGERREKGEGGDGWVGSCV